MTEIDSREGAHYQAKPTPGFRAVVIQFAVKTPEKPSGRAATNQGADHKSNKRAK